MENNINIVCFKSPKQLKINSKSQSNLMQFSKCNDITRLILLELPIKSIIDMMFVDQYYYNIILNEAFANRLITERFARFSDRDHDNNSLPECLKFEDPSVTLEFLYCMNEAYPFIDIGLYLFDGHDHNVKDMIDKLTLGDYTLLYFEDCSKRVFSGNHFNMAIKLKDIRLFDEILNSIKRRSRKTKWKIISQLLEKFDKMDLSNFYHWEMVKCIHKLEPNITHACVERRNLLKLYVKFREKEIPMIDYDKAYEYLWELGRCNFIEYHIDKGHCSENMYCYVNNIGLLKKMMKLKQPTTYDKW